MLSLSQSSLCVCLGGEFHANFPVNEKKNGKSFYEALFFSPNDCVQSTHAEVRTNTPERKVQVEGCDPSNFLLPCARRFVVLV